MRPDIKRGNFSNEEEETIIKLHQIIGNRYNSYIHIKTHTYHLYKAEKYFE